MTQEDNTTAWTERRLIGVAADRWGWARAARSQVTAVVNKTTALAQTTAQTTAATATSGTVAAVAAGKGGTAAVVATKAAAAAATTATTASTAAAGAATAALSAATAAAASTLGALGALVAAPAIPVALAAGAAGAGVWKLWKTNLEDGLLQLTPADCEGFTFPPGHPQPSAVYALHPLQHSRYLNLSLFHTALFTEKHNELMQLLAALGARRITVTCESGHARADAFSDPTASPVEAPTPLSDAHLPPPQQPPHIPPGLRWLAHTPAWQEAAQQRLHGASELRLSLDWLDDLGVHAQLVTNLGRAGWRLRDEAVHFVPTTWQVHATFSPHQG